MILFGERTLLPYFFDLMDNALNSNCKVGFHILMKTCTPFSIPESLRTRLTKVLDSIHQFTIDQGLRHGQP